MKDNILEKIKKLCDEDNKNSSKVLAEIKKLVKDADYPDFSTIKDGDHFEYRGHEWVRLGREGGGILCVVAKEIKNAPFNPCGSNDWRKSAIRENLNTRFIKALDEDKFVPYVSDLVADNGDDQYGKCEDKVFLLSAISSGSTARFSQSGRIGYGHLLRGTSMTSTVTVSGYSARLVV